MKSNTKFKITPHGATINGVSYLRLDEIQSIREENKRLKDALEAIRQEAYIDADDGKLALDALSVIRGNVSFALNSTNQD